MSIRVTQGLASRPNFQPLSVVSPIATVRGDDWLGREVPFASFAAAQKRKTANAAVP